MSKEILKNRMLKYYELEKKAGILFLILGIISPIFIFLTKSSIPHELWRGLTYPIVILSIIQIVVGIQSIIINDKKGKEWANSSTEDSRKFLSIEQNRIKKVDLGLDKLANIFMLLILLGGVFVLLGFIAYWGDFSIGTGFGLLMPSAIIYLTNQYRAFNVGTQFNYLNNHLK